jgi:CobQ-like glutamine amidotransferase family enzyme
MTEKRKDRVRWHQATLTSSGNSSKSPALRRRIKTTVVTLALCGALLVLAGEWNIHRGGLRHA